MERAKHYDAVVVGCGFAGAVVAHELVKSGNNVLIIEKRNHIAGNMYDAPDDSGVMVHWYGPHIFHTNSSRVFEFLKPFSDWFPYEHRVLASVNGQLVPLPFNFTSLEMLFEECEAKRIEHKLTESFQGKSKVSVLDLLNSNDAQIKSFGDFVYENVFAHYSAKQWGVDVKDVDRRVIDRVPVVLGYDDRYFHDKIQFMPKDGFTSLFRSLLDLPGITIELGTDATDVITIDHDNSRILIDGIAWNKPVVYTGPIDELFGYRFGKLPYRSLDLAFEQHDVERFQPAAVVNYPNEEEFTRITEFKYLTRQQIDNKTTVLKEYPLEYDPSSKKGNVPYYPVINDDNLERYGEYRAVSNRCKNLFLCGRLAEFSYYNMDAIVGRALEVANEVRRAEHPVSAASCYAGK